MKPTNLRSEYHNNPFKERGPQSFQTRKKIMNQATHNSGRRKDSITESKGGNVFAANARRLIRAGTSVADFFAY